MTTGPSDDHPTLKPLTTTQDVYWSIFSLIGAGLTWLQIRRSGADFVGATALALIAVLLGLLVLMAKEGLDARRAKGLPQLQWGDLVAVLGAIGSTLVFAWILTGYMVSAVDLARIVVSWLSDPQTDRIYAAAVVGALVLFVGLALWAFRLVARVVYGVSEVAAGLVVAVFQVTNVPTGTPILSIGMALALLTAGVYLVVRGLDNIDTGLKSERPDVFLFAARKIRKRFQSKGSTKPSRR